MYLLYIRPLFSGGYHQSDIFHIITLSSYYICSNNPTIYNNLAVYDRKRHFCNTFTYKED